MTGMTDDEILAIATSDEFITICGAASRMQHAAVLIKRYGSMNGARSRRLRESYEEFKKILEVMNDES